jgi:hypothetical protein
MAWNESTGTKASRSVWTANNVLPPVDQRRESRNLTGVCDSQGEMAVKKPTLVYFGLQKRAWGKDSDPIDQRNGNCRVLHVFGFRADESPDRAKKEPFKVNVQLTTKRRKVFDYLPIHDWTVEMVWDTIKGNDLPYHYAYDLGMPRLSCCFCIFSPFDALVVAGRANPDLLDEYIAAEKITGHSFKDGFEIASVKKAIEEGYQPNNISNWIM